MRVMTLEKTEKKKAEKKKEKRPAVQCLAVIRAYVCVLLCFMCVIMTSFERMCVVMTLGKTQKRKKKEEKRPAVQGLDVVRVPGEHLAARVGGGRVTRQAQLAGGQVERA